MMMYGVAVLAFSYLTGQLFGEYLGEFLGVKANVGGVGFAMILLLLCKEWLQKKGLLNVEFEKGVDFWNKMYIPVIIAMSASQNVKVAVSSGFLALIVGSVPVIAAFFTLPFLIKLSQKN
jgi:malonate transporter MadL subunit